MLSFADLLKAIDKFYLLAQRGKFSITKKAAEDDVYEKIDEDVYDKLINNDFANLFDKYKDAYKNFTNSLNINPKEFGRILFGGETEDDNFADLLVPFQEAYRNLITSTYLQQGLQDPNWEEGLSPQDIKNGIETLAKDANNKMFKLGKVAGVSESQVRDFLESREDAFQNQLEGKGDPGTGEGMSTKEVEYRNRKLQQARDYAKAHRQRRKEGLSVGRDELIRQQSDLQDQISKETNSIKREELQRRLNNLDSLLKTVINFEAHQKAQYEKIMSDPALRDQYVQENTKRRQNSRSFNKKFHELIDHLNESDNPNEQAKIKSELVRLKKELIQKRNPGIDFDSPEVKYNPTIQAELNPDKIIADYSERRQQIIQKEDKRHIKRLLNKAVGNLLGLATKYSEAVASELSQVKYNLNAIFDNDPAVKPYKDAIAKAKAARDTVGVKNATKALASFLNGESYQQVKQNHPSFKAALEMSTAMRGWLYLVKQIDQSKVLDSESMTESVRQQIIPIIVQGKELIKKYNKNTGINQKAQDIIFYMEDRI
jgi:hypothetical protein